MSILLEQLPQAPITKQQIAQYLPLRPIIIEAGAHIGRDSIKMAKLWPAGTIYAFEPVPALFEQLKHTTESYANIYVFNSALSNTNGQARLYISGGASTACSSLLEPKECKVLQPQVLFEQEIIVKTVTLDTWADQHNIKQIDFLWFDMQGSELNALQGAQKILPTVQVIFIEVNLTERYTQNPTFDEIAQFLYNFGLKPLQKDAPKHNKINVLFAR